MGRRRRRHRWCLVCQTPFRPPHDVEQTCCSQDCVAIADATARLDATAWQEYERWFDSIRNFANSRARPVTLYAGESTVDIVEFRVGAWSTLQK